MRKELLRCAALAACLIAASVAPIRAETLFGQYQVVKSGSLARMGVHYELFPDCRSRGPTQINVIEPPQNGQILIGPGRIYPQFRTTSIYSACARRQVSGTAVYYQSNPGFVGTDRYVVEAVRPSGDAHQYARTVSVR